MDNKAEKTLWKKQYNFIPTRGDALPVLDTSLIMNEMNNSSATQVGGSHYKKCTIQPWDYTIANDLDYFQGSIIKYVTRWKDKGWIQDLYKARHFLDKYIETMEEKHKALKERPE